MHNFKIEAGERPSALGQLSGPGRASLDASAFRRRIQPRVRCGVSAQTWRRSACQGQRVRLITIY